jgi:MFS family permease
VVTQLVAYAQGLNSGLPRSVYILQSGLVLNAFGNGAAAPFLVIYLHDVRGIPLGVAGLASATAAACGLLAALAAGVAGDRVGAQPTMIAGLALSIAAYAFYPLLREPWQAFALAALAGAGLGTWLTMQSSLLAAVTPANLRHTAFAQQRVAANLGLGLGGMAGGLLVTVGDPQSFTRLFFLNAATFAVYALFVLRLEVTRVQRTAGTDAAGYRRVLGDRAFVGVELVNLLLVAGAVALLVSLFPVFAKNDSGVGEKTIGMLFLLNSLLIVLAQLPVARAHEGHRRMRGLAMVGALFAIAWVLVQTTPLAGETTTVALLVVAVLVFALGECLYDTVQGPLVADLAPPELRSRYMAVNGFVWQLGFIAGPGLGGLLLAADRHALWPAAASLCIAGAMAALAFERWIPPRYRTTPTRRPSSSTPGLRLV